MRSSAALGALALALAPVAVAAGVPLLVVGGDLPRPGSLKLDELKALGAMERTWTSHGKAHKVVGVRLDRVLTARGFTPGTMGKNVPKAEKRAGFRKVVLATASDGFQALLSCAEIAEQMGPTVALLVWEIDGAPLEADKGPLRLVVITDQDSSRSIYAVQRIEVLDVAALAAQRR